VLSSGETVVTVVGRGTGGRNQEFTLAAAEQLAFGAVLTSPPDDRSSWMLASVGTDGIDGPTEAAGALADRTTVSRARTLGLGDPRRFLEENDANGFFSQLGDLIYTGPTQTNVGDLQVVLVT
jgi:hydroxypyruvate reductase